MTDVWTDIKQKTAELHEDIQKRIHLDCIRIEAGALREAALYVTEKGYRNVIVTADAATYKAAGERVSAALAKAGVSVLETIIKPDRKGDVLADEPSLIQLLLDIQQSTAEAVIAVGGGTIHDIVRYCAYTAGIPFISVPTAPSVDGFNSKGAPILTRGEKKTVPAIGPDAVFADLDILSQAPPVLAAAGFGDMLGKYTSLFDWKFGSITAEEPYLQAAADITHAALMRCVRQADAIARRDEEGIRTLTASLIESGLAMLLFGQSHPASGAEHHLSHYWEMYALRSERKQLLHGAKVGVACIEISKLYHRIAADGAQAWADSPQIAGRWDEAAAYIRQIPDERTLKDLLRQVGGPATIQELGVDEQLLELSLREAHLVRPNRCTLLRAYNQQESRPSFT